MANLIRVVLKSPPIKQKVLRKYKLMKNLLYP